MKDLSNWVRRDGKEILFGPAREANGQWIYLYLTVNGYHRVCHVGKEGRLFHSLRGEHDLVPPVEYGYLSEGDTGLVHLSSYSSEHVRQRGFFEYC